MTPVSRRARDPRRLAEAPAASEMRALNAAIVGGLRDRRIPAIGFVNEGKLYGAPGPGVPLARNLDGRGGPELAPALGALAGPEPRQPGAGPSHPAFVLQQAGIAAE